MKRTRSEMTSMFSVVLCNCLGEWRGPMLSGLPMPTHHSWRLPKSHGIIDGCGVNMVSDDDNDGHAIGAFSSSSLSRSSRGSMRNRRLFGAAQESSRILQEGRVCLFDDDDENEPNAPEEQTTSTNQGQQDSVGVNVNSSAVADANASLETGNVNQVADLRLEDLSDDDIEILGVFGATRERPMSAQVRETISTLLPLAFAQGEGVDDLSLAQSVEAYRGSGPSLLNQAEEQNSENRNVEVGQSSDNVVIVEDDSDDTSDSNNNEVEIIGFRHSETRPPIFAAVPANTGRIDPRFVEEYMNALERNQHSGCVNPSQEPCGTSQNSQVQGINVGPHYWTPPPTSANPTEYHSKRQRVNSIYSYMETDLSTNKRPNAIEDINFLFTCPICYSTIARYKNGRNPGENDRVVYSTKCGHIFCFECIEGVRRRKECPICRKPVRERSHYHVLYP